MMLKNNKYIYKYIFLFPFYFFTSFIFLFSCQDPFVKQASYSPFEKKLLVKSAAWSNILKLKNGDLAIFYQKANDIGIPNQVQVSIEMIKSFDGGSNWTKPQIVFDDLQHKKTDWGYSVSQARNIAVGILPSGRIIVAFTIQEYSINPEGQPITISPTPASFIIKGLYTIFSDNNGLSFSPPKKVISNYIIAPTPHDKIVIDKYGNAFMSVYGATNSTWTNSSVEIFKSIDKGESFQFYSTVEKSQLPPFGETSLLITNQNSHAFVRAPSNETIHYISSDNLKTWQFKGAVTENMQIPSQPRLLENNNILLFSGNRKLPFGIVGRISNDYGLSFGDSKRIVELSSYNHGYPNAVQKNNNIILTYYEMPTTNRYKEDWLDSEIFIVKFSEEDFKNKLD